MDRRDLIDLLMSNFVNYCLTSANKVAVLCYKTKSVELSVNTYNSLLSQELPYC